MFLSWKLEGLSKSDGKSLAFDVRCLVVDGG